MKSRYLAPIAVASVLLLGFAAPASATVGLVTVSGPSPYATCAIGAPGTNFPNAEVEPYVSVNPANTANIVGVWQQDRWSNGGAHGLVAGFSFDGGQTWGQTTLPFSQCAAGAAYERASDPWVSFGPDGTAYANAISFDASTARNAVTAATSTDGGKTWSNLATLQSFDTTQFATDKNSITADPLRPGVAYSVWDTLTSPNGNPQANLHTQAFNGPAYLSITTDGGRSWSTPQIIFNMASRQQTIGNQVLVDRAHPGTLYDFTNFIRPPNSRTKSDDTIAFVKSTDGGQTWSDPRVVTDMNDVPVVDPNTGEAVRTGDIIPEPAIAPDGTLYVTWQDGAFSGGSIDEIALISSSDGGATWTAPHRVSASTGRPAFTPSITVASDGTVAITYYDFRNLTPGNTTTLPTDYWFISSKDGFAANTHITGPFDMKTAPDAGGFFVGDYEGLAALGTSFQPFFVATNSGNLSNPTDVFTTTITP
jgi:photosystem II stability/assembly factor-like uncharacterized protein